MTATTERSAATYEAGSHRMPERGPLALLDVAKRHRRLVLGVVGAAIALAIVYKLAAPPRYMARTTFVPQSRTRSALPAALGGLAAQFGVATESGESPRFYAEVVRSRPILESVIHTPFPDPRTDGIPIQLIDLLVPPMADSVVRLDRAVKRLRSLVASRVDVQTNMVTVEVQSRYRDISAAAANRFLEYLNAFNSERRQSQARMRRIFVERRVAEADSALRAGEDDLRTFYEQNRSYQHSPQLVFQEGRLKRRIDVLSEVYLTLRRELEMSRVEEVNDTPVITVIEPAVSPRDQAGLGWKMLLVLAVAVGTTLGLVTALGVEHYGLRRSNTRLAA